MKKRLVLLIFAIVASSVGYWLFNHSYIEIVVSNPGGDFTYRFLDQKSQKTNEVKNNSSKLKKLVGRGSHEIIVTSGEVSYFTVAKANGFLGTTKVQATLQPEKSREFIGDNPSPCAHYAAAVLISFGCGDTFDNVQVHEPATDKQPTYIRKTGGVINGYIEGLVATGEGTVAVIRSREGVTEEDNFPHTAFLLGNDIKLKEGVALNDLGPEKYYTATSYKTGFVVYDDSFEEIIYYAGKNAKASPIAVQKPAKEGLKPYLLSAKGDYIILVYSNNTEGEVADIHEDSDKVRTTVMVTNSNNQVSSYEFKGQYAQVVLCGKDKLCLWGSHRLNVYDITKEKPKFLYMVSNVSAINSSGEKVIVVREGEALGLDVESRVGSIDYKPGEYTPCGVLHENESSYTLCLINSKQKKFALRIKQEPVASNGKIDQQLATLLKMPEVNDISAYGKFIRISPNLGEAVYVDESQSFGYDPATKVRVNGVIKQAIDALGIDRNTYQIINPFE